MSTMSADGGGAVVLVSTSAPDSPITAWSVGTGTQVGTLRGNAGGRAGLTLVGGPAGIGAGGGGHCGGGGGNGGGGGALQPPIVVSAQAGKAVLHTWLLGKVSAQVLVCPMKYETRRGACRRRRRACLCVRIG